MFTKLQYFKIFSQSKNTLITVYELCSQILYALRKQWKPHLSCVRTPNNDSPHEQVDSLGCEWNQATPSSKISVLSTASHLGAWDMRCCASLVRHEILLQGSDELGLNQREALYKCRERPGPVLGCDPAGGHQHRNKTHSGRRTAFGLAWYWTTEDDALEVRLLTKGERPKSPMNFIPRCHQNHFPIRQGPITEI